jgi:hypothetical protein
MRHWRGTGAAVGATVALALALVAAPPADARGRGDHDHDFHRGGGRIVVGGGFYNPYFGFGPWGYGPWGYGPWGYGSWRWGWAGPGYYGPEDHIDALTIAKMTGWGAIDLKVKPNSAEVWVDGKYQAEARDLDGNPSYLWLEKGPHHLTIYKGGYKTFSEKVEVERGVLKDLKVRLEKGSSVPPGEKLQDQRKQDKQKEETSRAGQGGQAD